MFTDVFILLTFLFYEKVMVIVQVAHLGVVAVLVEVKFSQLLAILLVKMSFQGFGSAGMIVEDRSSVMDRQRGRKREHQNY